MREFFFNLSWLIPLLPLLAFFIIILFTGKNRTLSHSIAIGAIVLSWVLGWGAAFSAFLISHLYKHPIHLYTGWFPTGTIWFHIGTWIDPLSAITLFMVPFLCLMIFIYSVGYMGYGTDEVDPHYSRFFAYISLFAAGMLGLTVSENLLTLFISWQIMGLCSFLLIGFWFEKSYPDPKRITPRQAGLKAFLVTKVGDLFFLLGILYLYSQTGSLSYDVIFDQEVLHALAEHTVTLPLLGTWAVASVIGLLIFVGAVGKSAQFPLHVWLPDAMEGPTPVSALIHAATMVSAGVYLLARIFPLLSVLEHGPHWDVIAFIGPFTALFASTIALAQDDIKRVLAYSTISQLGYMITALSLGAYEAGVFHMITHAFFKALLFLGSGSVIHGVEHGHHEIAHKHGEHEEHGQFDANDMMNMGGLGRKMPRTTWSFLAGVLALAGVFPFAGFWSKDEIEEFLYRGVVSWRLFIWLLLTVAGFLTAFYIGRQVFLVFTGPPRTEAAAHAHESPGSMTWPLVILAPFAAFLGLVGTPWINIFHHLVGEKFPGIPFTLLVATISILMALGGLFASWLVYGQRPLTAGQPDPLVKALGPAHTVLKNKYYFDELYRATVIPGAIALADFFFKLDNRWVIDPLVNLTGRATVIFSTLNCLFDTYVVDGFVNLVGIVTGKIGRGLRLIQTGRVQNYLLVAFISVLMLLGLHLIQSLLFRNVAGPLSLGYNTP